MERADRGDLYQEGLDRDQRRAAGVYYTPPALATYVVAETLVPILPRLRWDTDGAPRLRVLDPAAGSGRFLVAAADVLADVAAERGFDRAAARAAIIGRCLVGIERDEAAATLAREALGPGADVRVGDVLLGGAGDGARWDAIVGNPPYVRSVTLKREDPDAWQRLRGAFRATSYKEWDVYAAFVEWAARRLVPGGECGLLVPSRIFTAAFAAPLRGWLGGEGLVRKVVDFGHAQLFRGATTYTAALFLGRTPTDATPRRAVQVARLEDATQPAVPPTAPAWAQGAIDARTLGEAPWVLTVGARAREATRLAASGPTLGSVARISKGAGTNADPIFVRPVDAWRVDGVEPDHLVPVVRGRDVGALTLAAPCLALLPYKDGKLVPFDALPPGTRAWLLANRAALEAREDGRYVGESFHRWGRPQNLVWHLDPAPKVMVPDATLGGRAGLDRHGWLALDSAYAVRPTDPRVAVGLIYAVLASPVVPRWLGATGIQLRGGYVRMKTAYLLGLPLPDPATPAAREVAALAENLPDGDAAAREELISRVLALY